jgi:hypothetical protein
MRLDPTSLATIGHQLAKYELIIDCRPLGGARDGLPGAIRAPVLAHEQAIQAADLARANPHGAFAAIQPWAYKGSKLPPRSRGTSMRCGPSSVMTDLAHS